MKSKIKFLYNQFKSLRALIFALVFVAGLLPSLFIRYGILQNYESRAISLRTQDVQNQLNIIGNHLVTYNYLTDTSSEVINAELDQLSSLYDGRVLIINDHLKIIKDSYGISEGKVMISEEVVRCLRGESISNYDRADGYIELVVPIIDNLNATSGNSKSGAEGTVNADGEDENVNNPNAMGALLISVSTDSIMTTLDILSKRAGIILSLSVIGLFVIAILFSGLITNPLKKLSKAILEIKNGHSDEPISGVHYLEIKHLVETFNQLLSMLQEEDRKRQEFVANVSHELKTPLTSVKVLAESINSLEDAPVDMYKEFMTDIANEVERENKIINDLLALVKLENKVAELNISQVNINELTELILKRLSPIARKSDIEITFESHRVIEAQVDEVKLSQVITNLVENAIKYNKEHGFVYVLLDADHQYFTLTVRDTGIGIPQEAAEQIFDRFYRVDKSHSREIGGTGLGLAIAKSAVLLHKGSIEVESTEGDGTTFIVRIPLIYQSV